MRRKRASIFFPRTKKSQIHPEQGRWDGNRDGRATGGKFASIAGLVTSNVCAAAQYKKDQGEVWGNVARVNEAHKKGAPSGTLLATLDVDEVDTRRARLASRVNEFLADAAKRDSGAALDALTAEAERGGGPAPSSVAPKPKDVVSFVDDVEKAAVAEERDTKAANQNEYKESERAYGSKTRRKGAPAAPAPALPVSSDYVAK